MCCSNAAWKREEVPDHKFDFINVREFHATNFTTRLQYLWLYILVGKSGAVYIADIYTAIALLASNHWSGSVLQSAAAKSGGSTSSVLEVPFSIGKWVFAGCIIFSFLLVLWEARKARAIIKSRDISYAFTNVMSQNYYSLRSYDHFCFFTQIDNSKKKKDEFAFFIFFTFKGWKQLLLADGPRQVINAITLYSFGKSENWTTDVSVYFGGSLVKAGIIITMLFTLIIWVGSALLMLVAAVMYVPLLCYIQGNLKEYCCHKVDKRIAELMKRKNRKRLAKEAEMARKEAKGDFSHLKDAKTGKFVNAPLPQPTLPKISLRDDELYTGSEKGSIRVGVYPPPPPSFSGTGGGSEWGGGRKGTLFRPQDDRPFQQFQDSRPPFIQPTEPARYAYTSSDPNTLRSGTSLAAVASRREPNAFDSSTTLVGGEAGRGVPQRSQTNVTVGSGRPPSWGSGDDYSGGESEEKGYYDDDGFGYADEYGVPSQPLPVLGREEPRRHAPPSRQQQQQLYARATAPSGPPSEMEYTMRDEEGVRGRGMRVL